MINFRESLADYSFLSNPTISPGANYVLYTKSNIVLADNEYLQNLWVFDKKSQTATQLTSSGKDSSGIWLDHHTVLFSSRRNQSKDDKKRETVFYRIDVRGGEAKKAFSVPVHVSEITHLEGDRYLITAIFDPRWKDWENADEAKKIKIEADKGKENWTEIDEIPYWSNGVGYTDKKRSRLYLFDAAGPTLEPLTDESTMISDYSLHSDKKQCLVICQTYDSVMPLKDKIAVIDLETKETNTFEPIPNGMIHFAGFVNDEVLLLATDTKQFGLNEDPRVYRMDPFGAVTKISEPNFCMSFGSSVGSDLRYGGGRQVKTDGDNLYFIATVGYRSELYRMELSGEVFPLITKDGSVDSFDVQNGIFYFVGMQNMRGQELYDQIGRRLTFHNEEVEEPLPIEIFEFESRGTVRTGFAISPKEIGDGQKAPAILTIHGGPKTVFGTVLHHEMQLLARSGFYVFYTNPHGSDGYGREFMDIRGKYGSVDYEDLMACVDGFLESYPDADAERLGVMGGSYGGYMTNWIIGHTERFKAACSQRSISNWVSFFGTSDIGYFFVNDQVGDDPWSNPDRLWENSPIRYANLVKTPTLFIHSDQDYRCWLPEGMQMYTALKYLGVPTRLVVFHGENHELSRSGKPLARMKRLQEIVDWFSRYLR